jgi:hypothetical protein
MAQLETLRPPGPENLDLLNSSMDSSDNIARQEEEQPLVPSYRLVEYLFARLYVVRCEPATYALVSQISAQSVSQCLVFVLKNQPPGFYKVCRNYPP